MRSAGARVVRALSVTVVCTVLAGVVGGCGASPAPLGPSGTDGLTIPTPSPDPGDFVDRVDNPWFPLVPGTVWTYRHYTPYGSWPVRATVIPGHHDIAGVATTAVRWQVTRAGRRMTVDVRWYAEDRGGNVWWFGQRVRRPGLLVDDLARRSWVAGRGGAEAGLVLSAVPRVGDGYLNAAAPRVVERRSTVISLTATVATPGRTYHDTVLTRDASSLVPTHVVESFFARGIGLVAQETRDATTSQLSLVRVGRR
jgi:hypothetical protein